MKPEGQIRHKLVQVRFRHLKREIRGGLSRRPQNCSHNGTVASPSGPFGVCLLGSDKPDSWNGTPCDERFGGDVRAGKCPYFDCVRSKDEIKQDFNAFLYDASLPEVAEKYPDMAALLWVLEEDSPPALPPEVEDSEDGSVEPSPPPEEPTTPPEEPTTPPVESISEAPTDEGDDLVTREPFRPATWKLVVVSLLMFFQSRINSLIDSVRRG